MPGRHRSLIENLAFEHHATRAYRTLMQRGLEALPDVREGLYHSNADVRYHCCRFLDRYLEPETIGDLVGMLDDADERVRISALHTLACDRCKEGSCRPEEARVLPLALNLLANDRSYHVRAMAIEVVGQFVHTNPDAEAALLKALATDANPTVRKKASWYAPGGPIHGRIVPKVKKRKSGSKTDNAQTV
jgi:HEAT repeat protein